MFGINPSNVNVPEERPEYAPIERELVDAARRFNAAGQTRNGEICEDMARKLRQFGSFASTRQADFARSLVSKSKSLTAPVGQFGPPQAERVLDTYVAGYPDVPDAVLGQMIKSDRFADMRVSDAIVEITKNVMQPAPQPVPGLPVPDLFAVMQKHAKFYVGDVTITRKNQDSLCWIKHANYERVIGKIEDGRAYLFYGRIADNDVIDSVKALLLELEANPLAAAMKYGKLAGRCCSCGRDLTDPESIAAGIGPICAEKFA